MFLTVESKFVKGRRATAEKPSLARAGGRKNHGKNERNQQYKPARVAIQRQRNRLKEGNGKRGGVCCCCDVEVGVA